MELIIYIFLFLILFLGVTFNLKITNFKKVKEIRNKAKDYSKKNDKYVLLRLKFNFLIWSKYGAIFFY